MTGDRLRGDLVVPYTAYSVSVPRDGATNCTGNDVSRRHGLVVFTAARAEHVGECLSGCIGRCGGDGTVGDGRGGSGGGGDGRGGVGQRRRSGDERGRRDGVERQGGRGGDGRGGGGRSGGRRGGGGRGGGGRGQATNSYADKAAQRLDPLKGPKFKKSMRKSKRSTYSGGEIDKHAVSSTRLAE